MEQLYFVYIVTNRPRGTLYIGMTDDLNKRAWQHREHVIKGSFSDKYNLEMLVWFEAHPSRESAFVRERRMKKWNRAWKIRLIEEMNPDWRDLAEVLL
ncbi:MAG: GIY-YIG nuclease family protein [Pseudomonadota bacterium]